jgi:ribonuclease BN (tRNA processing enzyme)
MMLKILGSGSEENINQGNVSLLINAENKNFLINCGYTVFPYLIQKKLAHKIDRIFISNRDQEFSGSLASLIFYNYKLKRKLKFYGLSENLSYLKEINPQFINNAEEFFILKEEDSIKTIPTFYKKINSESFFNYGLLYSGPTSETLLDNPQARKAKVIIHHVSFKEGSEVVHFNSLARAADVIKAKTWLIGYDPNDDIKFESKAKLHGFRGFLKQDNSLKF